MAKFGIGVGEEFPVEEPQRKPEESEEALAERRRYWRRHQMLHLATRIAVIALILAAIVWMFVPHPYAAGPYAPYGYGYHRHFFFPFFPLLLFFVIAMAWRRGGCWRGRHRHHGHRGGHDGGEA